MAITLGSVTFDEGQTSFDERYEEVAGRDERVVVVKGSIGGLSSVAAVESALDAVLDAASVDGFSAVLSLRDGRRLFVQREAFERQVLRDRLCGAFTLTLRARNPFEESVSETQTPWSISASGATLNVSSSGNVFAMPSISLVATGTVIDPSFSDGVNAIAYSGSVADGETLVFDGVLHRATLEGVDVTPYVAGDFPRVAPEGTTLTYTDDASSSHTATVTVAYRDRWW